MRALRLTAFCVGAIIVIALSLVGIAATLILFGVVRPLIRFSYQPEIPEVTDRDDYFQEDYEYLHDGLGSKDFRVHPNQRDKLP